MNWAMNFSDLDSTVLVEEFVMLFMALEPVQLNHEKDIIKWRWTDDGIFSVSSAYNCQFKGLISQFPSTPIWKPRVEPKCRFFDWLALHAKILTADNM
jgi:hypothetical protein